MPIRTSEKVSVEGNSWQVEYSPLWRSIVNLETPHGAFHAGHLEDRPIPSWISDWLLKKVKRDCLWSSHLTPDKVNADQDIREVKAYRKKSHLSCLTSEGSFITPDFVGTIPPRFPIHSEEGPRVIVSEGLCRSGSENINAKDNISPFWALRMSGISKKVTRCSHAWPLQDLSLRLISLARFRLIPSVSEGYIPRIPPRSSTRRTITKKKHHWVFQSRSRMKNPEAAAASQQLARYWRCLVLVQATALGNHSETVFLRQVCFLNWRGLGSGSVSTTDEPLMTGKRDRGESIGQSMRDRENLHKIRERERLSHQFKGRMKLRKIIRDWSWCGN